MSKAVITQIKFHEEPFLVCVLMEGTEAVEVRLEGKSPADRTGRIFTARTERIASNIQAAFLHDGADTRYYLPLKNAPAGIKCGDIIPVRIVREQSGQKLSSVTANVSLPGKYFVMSPGEGSLKASARLKKEEQERLVRFVKSIPDFPAFSDHMEIMIRTNAAEASEEILKKEFRYLAATLEKIISTGSMRTAGCVLYEPEPFYIGMLQDIPNGSLEEIVTDLPDVENRIRLWQENTGAMLSGVRLYDDSRLPLYRLYGLTGVLEKLLEEKVWLKSGGFLMIQRTEAFTAVDVNSGKNTERREKEETLFRLNMEAAHEVCRQIRLRNLSGAILVDFVNMEEASHIKSLKEETERLLKADRVRSQVIDITRLQIMEITRNKISPPVEEILKKNRINSRDFD